MAGRNGGPAAPTADALERLAARTAAPGARFCARCVLPDTFPGVRFDDAGVCQHCRHHRRDEAKEERLRAALRERFESLVERVRDRPGHHVLVAYSGGKDSTATLQLLSERYGLRVLAVTVDNGFLSPQARANVTTVVERLGVDLLTVKPALALLTRVFAAVAAEPPYPPKALERASGVCNACIALVKNVAWRVALERRIPLLAWGWSPGQAPTRAALQQMAPTLLLQMHDARTEPLLRLAGPAMEPFTVPPGLFDGAGEAGEAPVSVNPLAFHPYSEAEVVAAVQALGWRRPADTDGNSSNCLLNGFGVREHVARLGFHPYACEVAELVRVGATTRQDGFAALADFGPETVHAEVKRRLGVG